MHFTEQDSFRLHFLGIGAPKAGTTWLSAVLGAHPDIYTPPEKEIEYFNQWRVDYDMPNRNHRQPVSWYHRHFRGAREGQRIGEVNPMYMLTATDASCIHRYHPGLKLIAILRDPVDRARSQFQFNQKWRTRMPPTLEEGLEQDPALLEDGLYAKLLEPFFALFPREQILVLFHQDLKGDAAGVYRKTLRFLDVPDFLPPNLGDRPNETRSLRSPLLAKALAASRKWMFRCGLENLRPALNRLGILRLATWLREEVNAGPPSEPLRLEPGLEARLRAYFLPDIEKLEAMTGRALPEWKSRLPAKEPR